MCAQAGVVGILSCYYDETLGRLIPVDENGNRIEVDVNGVPVDLTGLPKVESTKFEENINRPGLLLNGVPTTTSPTLMLNKSVVERCDQQHQNVPPGSLFAELETIMPKNDVKGSTVV